MIFLTAKTDTESVVKGFDLGTVDYITKPFRASELLARVKTHLQLKFTQKKLQEANATKDRLPELIQILETEFMPRWEELNDMLIMDDIKQFAADMEHAVREYDLPLITDYCGNLHEDIEIYDVVRVKKRIAEFPRIVERIKKIWR